MKFPNHAGGYHSYRIEADNLYDFLYERDYPTWLCNLAKEVKSTKRELKELIMRLQTGETQVKATPKWEWNERQKLGQEMLRSLAEDILSVKPRPGCELHKKTMDASAGLQSSLQLDGYIYSNGQLLIPESDVLDTEEETGVLNKLYSELGLDEKELAFHHLGLSEEHYLEKRWDDSISNSRKFLECVLAQIALKIAAVGGLPMSTDSAKRPVEVRDYLERANLLERNEKEALAKVYGLLSATGGHPYMAQEDQARLLRHLALTFTQFAMLRLKGRGVS